VGSEVVVKLGVLAPLLPGLADSGEFMREYAALLEDCGVESIWGVEHVVIAHDHEPRYPYSDSGEMGPAFRQLALPDALELLSFVAGASTRLNLGTAVILAPLHSPAVLAKRVATLDSLSGGRVILGLGIGWQKEEYAAVGAPFRARGARLEECMLAMRALWADSPATFRGEHWSFDRVYSNPRPARGSVPILLGGNSDPVIDRIGRLGDGWLPFTIGPDQIAESVSRICKVAEGVGRDPGTIEITAWPGSHDQSSEQDLDYVRRYVAAGASRLLFWPQMSGPDDLVLVREQLERYQDQILDKL
jgi:probable F420-dependent oxidoreductase